MILCHANELVTASNITKRKDQIVCFFIMNSLKNYITNFELFHQLKDLLLKYTLLRSSATFLSVT